MKDHTPNEVRSLALTSTEHHAWAMLPARVDDSIFLANWLETTRVTRCYFPRFLLILTLLLITPTLGLAASKGSPPKSEVLEVTEDGFIPKRLSLAAPASSVFLLNSSMDSLVTFEIDFGERLGFCATGKSWMDDSGILKSNAPIEPEGFRAFCFPQPGTYPIKIRGLEKYPEGLSTVIEVSE